VELSLLTVRIAWTDVNTQCERSSQLITVKPDVSVGLHRG
jgi:hypothetical protein